MDESRARLRRQAVRPRAAAGKPKRENPIRQVPRTPFLRYAHVKSNGAGDMGDCTATGVKLDVEAPAGMCPLVTAAHCLGGMLASAGREIIRGNDQEVCRGKNSHGFRTQLFTNLREEIVEAIALYPNADEEAGPDLALFLVPCELGMKQHPVLEEVTNSMRLTAYYPFSQKAIPGTPKEITPNSETFGSNGIFWFPGAAGIQGDSGTPVFEGTSVAGVLHGADGAGNGLFATGLAATGYDPRNPLRAKAKFKADLESIARDVKCEKLGPKS